MTQKQASAEAKAKAAKAPSALFEPSHRMVDTVCIGGRRLQVVVETWDLKPAGLKAWPVESNRWQTIRVYNPVTQEFHSPAPDEPTIH